METAGREIALSLAAALDDVAFSDRDTDAVTELLIEAIVAWGGARGWRVYRRAASVVPLPPPMQQQHSVLDVACARPDGPPVVVEVDHADRRRTVEKLAAEAAAGRTAIWVRWGSGRFTVPPPPVELVTVRVTSRTGRGFAAGQGRLHSRVPERDRPAPQHSAGGGSYTAEILDPEVELVLRAYAAFARGDIDGAVRDLAEDVDWVEPDEFPGGGHHHGRAAVARYLRASYDRWAQLRSEPVAHRRGEQVVVVHHVHGTLRDGTPHEVTVADVFTVEDGRVVLMMAYADPADPFR